MALYKYDYYYYYYYYLQNWRVLLQVEQNRQLLRPQIETLKLCAVQNISLRGHRDDGDLGSDVVQAVNDGNYRHLLRFRIASGDEALKNSLTNASANAKHTSKTIQNELLNVMAGLVKAKVTERVQKAEIWTILADETTDRSSREQLVMVARHVDMIDDKYVVREDTFSMIDVFAALEDKQTGEVKLSGENLGGVILQEIGKANLDINGCIGQGYDGAAAMSSEAAGAAAFVRKSAAMADYFHCISHATNLSCSKCTNIPVIRNAQDTMSRVINNFSTSAKRSNLLKKHAKLYDDCDFGKLITLCTTRFVERHASVSRFWSSLPATVSALQEQQLWTNIDAGTKAHALLSCLEKSETIVGLACLNSVASIMKPLSQALQKKGCDLSAALTLVDDTANVLQKMRTGDSTVTTFASIFEDISRMMQRIGSTVQKPRVPVGKSAHRAAAAADDVEVYFRVNVFNGAVDAVLVDFRDRFGNHVRLSAPLSCLLPHLVVHKAWVDVANAYMKYKRYLTGTSVEVEAEFMIWKQHWKNISFGALSYSMEVNM